MQAQASLIITFYFLTSLIWKVMPYTHFDKNVSMEVFVYR